MNESQDDTAPEGAALPVEPASSLDGVAADDPLLSNSALDKGAAALGTQWKVLQNRAPKDVRRRVREVLERVYAIINEGAAADVYERTRLSRLIDDLGTELRGQTPRESMFYREGRLAVITVYDPIKITGAVNHRRIERAFDRYLSRAERAFERLDYFLERAGVDVEKKAKLKPWEQPYAKFDNFRELLWGRITREFN